MTQDKNINAQSTVEFTFGMIVIMFLVYGMVMVFRWSGMDLANRRVLQDTSLTVANLVGGDPATQLTDTGDQVMPMDAEYHGSITNGNMSQ